jgi:hypothetical protein
MGAFAAPVMMGFQAASGVFNAMSSIQQGNAAAQQSLVDAKMAEQQGRVEADQAAFAYGNKITEGRDFAATQRAAAASTGALPTGSVIDVLASTRAKYEQDALNEKYRGDLAMKNAGTAASFARTRAKAQRLQGYQGAFSAILQAGANMGSTAYGK